MATINYYFDKPDKKGFSPIHLRINCNGEQIKISTKEKVKPINFNKKSQLLKGKSKKALVVNHFLNYLKDRASELLNNSEKKLYTISEVKQKLYAFIKGYKAGSQVNIVKECSVSYGKKYSFIDFFTFLIFSLKILTSSSIL